MTIIEYYIEKIRLRFSAYLIEVSFIIMPDNRIRDRLLRSIEQTLNEIEKEQNNELNSS